MVEAGAEAGTQSHHKLVSFFVFHVITGVCTSVLLFIPTIVLSIDTSFVQSKKNEKNRIVLKTIDSTIESMIVNTYVYYRISV